MFTLRDNTSKAKRMVFIYLGVTLLVTVFSLIYEMNAHGVYSFSMMFAFIYPLGFGLIPYLLLLLINKKIYPSLFTSDIYNAGVATATLSSLFKGVLVIYGTARVTYTNIFIASSVILLGIGIISYIVTLFIKLIKK